MIAPYVMKRSRCCSKTEKMKKATHLNACMHACVYQCALKSVLFISSLSFRRSRLMNIAFISLLHYSRVHLFLFFCVCVWNICNFIINLLFYKRSCIIYSHHIEIWKCVNKKKWLKRLNIYSFFSSRKMCIRNRNHLIATFAAFHVRIFFYINALHIDPIEE